MSERITKRQNRIIVVLSILVISALGYVGWTSWRAMTLEAGEKVIISGGTTIQKPLRSIARIEREPNGDVIVHYTDGTNANIGHAKAKDGKDAVVSDAQIAYAVKRYCDEGRCSGASGKNVTPEDVSLAVKQYCTSGRCKGSEGSSGLNGIDGKDGKDAIITNKQIDEAVARYCTNGNCKGAKGDVGASGKEIELSCVIENDTGIIETYIAWRYKGEPNSSFKKLAEAPNGWTGINCKVIYL